MPTTFEPGAPVTTGIPLCVPHLAGREWEYVKECLDTNLISAVGPFVEQFEAAMCRFLGCPHALATVNGTAALHTALLVAGVRPGDEVLVSDLTFVAPANAIRYAGARPVFIDAEPGTWQISPAGVSDYLRLHCWCDNGVMRSRISGAPVRAIIPVHILGHPANMPSLLPLAREFGLTVIEDASESLGASCGGRPVGTWGDLACFSFNGNKIISTGGGGMLVTVRPDWARRARHLSTQAKQDPLEYVHDEIGYNYRLTNVLAALGCAQVEQLRHFVAAKRRLAAAYRQGLYGLPGVILPQEADWAYCSYWLYTIRLDPVRARLDRRALLHALAAEGIQSRPLWQPMHLSPAHAGCGPQMPCPVSEQLYQQSLSLPSSTSLTPQDQARVIAAVRRALEP